MVRLNFKTKSPLPVQKEAHKTENRVKNPQPTAKKPVERSDEDFDLSFNSTESLFPKAESQTAEKFKEEKIPQKPSAPRQPQKQVFQEFEDEYYSPKKSGFKTFLIIFLIIIMIGAGGYYGYNFFLKNKSIFTRKVKKAAPVEETAKPQLSAVAATMKPIFENNSGTNLFLIQQIENLIAKKPKSANYSLIVAAPSEIKLTVLSDSRNSFAQFKTDLSKVVPNLQFKTIGIQTKFQNGRETIYADLSAPIKNSKTGELSFSNQQLEKPLDFKSGIQDLSQKNKIKIQMYKQGKSIDKGNFNQSLLYVNLLGARENIIKLLSEVGQSIPNAHYNKISIFPYNLSTISEKNLVTRINLTYYNPK
jgi:hypothetical protein